MRAISDYFFGPTNSYGVRLVPSAANWGRGAFDRVLYYDSRPVTIWLVGRVRSTWFYDINGNPRNRVSLGIIPTVEGDLEAVNGLYDRARPASGKLE